VTYTLLLKSAYRNLHLGKSATNTSLEQLTQLKYKVQFNYSGCKCHIEIRQQELYTYS